MKTLVATFFVFCLNYVFCQNDSTYFRLNLPAPSFNSSLDSIVADFFTTCSLSTDSIAPIPADSLSFPAIKDSLINGLRATDVSGRIGLTYEFGLLAAYVDNSGALTTNVVRTEGDVTVSTLGLPVNISYNYCNFKNPLGVNNYFRASLDMDKFQHDRVLSKQKALDELEDKVREVRDQKDILTGKLGYSELLLDRLKREITDQEQLLRSKQAELDLAQQKNNIEEKIADSVHSRGDSTSLAMAGKADSLQQSIQALEMKVSQCKKVYDSVNVIYQQIYRLYDRYSSAETLIREQQETVRGYSKSYTQGGMPHVDAGWMRALKKLDVGLTYPQLTGLSKNSVPVKGLDVEFQKDNWYTAVTAGVMMNNLMVSNDLVQNQLKYTKNAFNMFDFQDVRQKQFIVNVKSGWGTKEGTHAFIGVRYTNKSVLTESFQQPSDSNETVIPSAGIELDLRYLPVFSPSTKIDLIYGKTSLSSLADSASRSIAASLFSGDRTNSSLIRITHTLKKLRSEVTASVRWLDPFADTRSLGVLQPDNLRSELKTTHVLTSKLRIGFDYRRDKNNLAGQLDSTVHTELYGTQFNGEIGRIISYFGSLSYLYQFQERNNTLTPGNSNYIVSAGVSGKYNLKETKNVVSFLYSDYRISDMAGLNAFKTVSLQNMTLAGAMQNTFSISTFSALISGQLPLNSVIISEAFGIKLERSELKAGIKIAGSKQYGNDIGGKIEYKRLFRDKLQLIFKAEKLVLGDYYNAYDPTRFKRFPYAFGTTLNYIIH